ncbi:hypothetical protein IAS59_003551 [Cryptococcus gattii]
MSAKDYYGNQQQPYGQQYGGGYPQQGGYGGPPQQGGYYPPPPQQSYQQPGRTSPFPNLPAFSYLSSSTILNPSLSPYTSNNHRRNLVAVAQGVALVLPELSVVAAPKNSVAICCSKLLISSLPSAFARTSD